MPDSSPSEEELSDEQFRANLQERLDRLDRGEGLVFENEEPLRRFCERVKAEGMRRYRKGIDDGTAG